jgi:pyruvate kinase
LSAKALTDKDREDIKLAVKLGVDFLALSFPRDATDVNEARSLYQQAGGAGLIVAKIERAEAIENLESIVDAADVVMVARGDLGVEVGYADLPGLQKRIIRLTRKKNRVAITATQMMESMVNSPAPTRAEVSDVANAVMDGSDAVMLSGETAIGKYPGKSIAVMASICEAAEKYQLTQTRSRHRIDSVFKNTDEAIAMATMYTANHMNVKAIIALTESGKTTLWMSRIRSDIPIFAFTRHVGTRRRVNLYRGVLPVHFDITQSRTDKVWKQVSERLLELGLVANGDLVIFTEGETIGLSGGTNSMKLLPVGG